MPLEEHSDQAALVAAMRTSDRRTHRAILVIVAIVLGTGNAPAAEPHAVAATNSLGTRFVRIEAGEFLMGSPADDAEADDDERPRHRVRISKPFQLAQFETTQREFGAVMDSNPSWFSATGGGRTDVAGLDTDRLPVDMTTWDEAAEFCRKLGDLPAERAAQRTYRLPTEAEWEFACRAGATTRYSTGATLTPSQACIRDSNANGPLRPRVVGSYPANPFGLYDMHGNVWEWCADRYDSDAYRHSSPVDPLGPNEGTGRVVRGGDYRFAPTMARSANRDYTRATRRDQGNGFRVVLELREP